MVNAGDITNEGAIRLKDPQKRHFLESMLLAWANAIERDMCTKYPILIHTLTGITLTYNTMKYGKVKDLVAGKKIIGVNYVTNVTEEFDLSPIDEDTLRQYYGESWRYQDASKPKYWYVDAEGYLCFWTPPSSLYLSSYTAGLVKLPDSDMTVAASVPEVDPICFDSIVDGIVMLGYAEDGKDAQAQLAEQRYNKGLQRMFKSLRNKAKRGKLCVPEFTHFGRVIDGDTSLSE